MKLTMKKNSRILLSILLVCFFVDANTQVFEPVKWENSIKKIDEANYNIVFKANIDKGWHMYGLNIPEGGPVATSFNIEKNNSFELIGDPSPSLKAEKVFDNTFEMELELFNGSVTFTQKIKLVETNAVIKGNVEFMSCDDSKCLPPVTKDFEFKISKNKKVEATTVNQDSTKTISQTVTQVITVNDSGISDNKILTESKTSVTEIPKIPTEERKSLWKIFLEALAKGIFAVFTPCVWPIIPLTVAFFMRDNTTGKRIFQALLFGLSIVVIYTSVGLLAGLAGIDIVELSKHWIANLIIFLLLAMVAASFFGMFELVLPGSLSNKLDKQVDKGGILAPFFLALVTAVVSFSCVGPFAGIALGAALTGEVLMPTVAMLGFSISFAFPFVIIGIFPELLKNLPKSGGWLNSVKVFFAFIVLAVSFIFLGNTQWKLFNRDVILSLEIVVFALLGFYLLGKIKFAHDSEMPYIKVPRLILAIISFAIAVYLVPGLFGSPLKAVSAFLPAPETTEFTFSETSTTPFLGSATNNPALCDSAPKYSDFLHMPNNLTGYFDYEQGMACAKKLNKPVLLDFAGHSCKNCKKMYAEVWSDSVYWKSLETILLLSPFIPTIARSCRKPNGLLRR
jgi:thiol:disulfide interchange protein